MDLLRKRAGLDGRKKRKEEDDMAAVDERRRTGGAETTVAVAVAVDAGPSTLMGAGGHINLFEDLEKVSCCCSSYVLRFLTRSALFVAPQSRGYMRPLLSPCLSNAILSAT